MVTIRDVLLESTPRLLVVHRGRPLAELDTDPARVAFEVDRADFGRTILDQLDDRYELLVLDWHLECPDACGVLDAFRQTAPESWVLALADETPEDDPVDRGADDVLVRPFSDAELRRTIDRLLLQRAYERTTNELFRLSTERAVLENELESDADVADRYRAVTEELRTCRERAASFRAALSSDSFDHTLRQLFNE